MSAKKENSEDNTLPVPAPSGLEKTDMSAMAAGLVHEVKNPLAAIHLHLQLLEGYVTEIEEEELKGRIQNKVGYIKNEILNLNESLQNLLRLIRAEKIKEFQEVDLNKIAQDVVSFLEPQASREEIRLELELGETDRFVRMDEAFVKQVLINLIINAVQAFEKSDRAPGERMVTVITGKEGGFNFVRVIDNGPGIPPETQEKIFEAFYSTRKKGSGLGLSLVKRMVASMGGHLELRSDPEHGTQFTVFLAGPDILSGSEAPGF